MLWRTLGLIVLMLVALATAKARAADCPDNPNALGTSRVLTIDPRDFPRIGMVQYSRSLPLEDKEVVLTFDDGPLPPYTNRVLDVLAEHCVKANYFLVGRMARGYPDLARRILAEGHTVGTHSENHLLGFDRAPLDTVKNEIEQGIVSVASVVGKNSAATSFFRIPGFLRRHEVETYLQSRHMTTWSADLVADDWRHISASEVVRRAIARLDEKGKGILLLHDIQPATALALPELLRELKTKGYRIVQVVPGKGEMSVPVAAKPAPMPAEAAPVDVAAISAAASAPTAIAVVKPMAALPANAADSFARGEDIAVDPVRPFTSGSRPSRNMPTPDKFVTTEPGGWPPTISVPVPRAGGIGVSSRAGVSQTPDGRFQER
jgi:peptidoglycan/xylan/chitin deacetylase (PgdA/CDA1 family)